MRDTAAENKLAFQSLGPLLKKDRIRSLTAGKLKLLFKRIHGPISSKWRTKFLWFKEREGGESTVLQQFHGSSHVQKHYFDYSASLLPMLEIYHQIHARLAQDWPLTISWFPTFDYEWIPVTTVILSVLSLNPNSIWLAASKEQGEYLVTNNEFVWWKSLYDILQWKADVMEVMVSWIQEELLSNTWLLFDLYQTSHQISAINIKVMKVDENWTMHLMFVDIAKLIIYFVLNNLLYRTQQLSDLLNQDIPYLFHKFREIPLDVKGFTAIADNCDENFLVQLISCWIFSFSDELKSFFQENQDTFPPSLIPFLRSAEDIQ